MTRGGIRRWRRKQPLFTERDLAELLKPLSV